jgi:hypothetical protein
MADTMILEKLSGVQHRLRRLHNDHGSGCDFGYEAFVKLKRNTGIGNL